jgi:hypothetical protein
MELKAVVDIGQNSRELLQQLAFSIGMTVDKAFSYYVKQVMIKGYVGVFLFFVLLAIGLILIKFNWKKWIWTMKNSPSLPLNLLWVAY